MLVEGQLAEPFTARPFVFFRAVAGGYIEAMGMPLLRGRSIDRGDVDRKEPNFVINKAFADGYFPSADPIGRRVRLSAPPTSSRPAPDWPRWRADGKELFYLGADGTMRAVPIDAAGEFDAGAPQALFRTGAAAANF